MFVVGVVGVQMEFIARGETNITNKTHPVAADCGVDSNST